MQFCELPKACDTTKSTFWITSYYRAHVWSLQSGRRIYWAYGFEWWQCAVISGWSKRRHDIVLLISHWFRWDWSEFLVLLSGPVLLRKASWQYLLHHLVNGYIIELPFKLPWKDGCQVEISSLCVMFTLPREAWSGWKFLFGEGKFWRMK